MTTAIYARISDDREGEALGVDRQLTDCRKAAGTDVPEALTFVDNDISASTRSRKARPAYASLLAAIRAGQVSRVVAYSNSRLTRRPAEWEELISLTEAHGLQIETVVSGNANPATADGRMVLRMLAATDAAEAERIGERVARQKRQRAEAGKPQGGRERLYGYSREWDVIEAEAEVIREAFARRISGESTTAIAGDFAARGITTVAGRLWSGGTLTTTLRKPGYAGLREFKGEILPGVRTTYPALIDEPTFHAAQSALVKASRGTNARRHLLSGFATCRTCGTPMKGATSAQRADRYRCAANYGGCGKTSIRSDWIDGPVVEAAITHMEAGAASRTEAVETTDHGPDIAALEAKLAGLVEAFAAGDLEAVDYGPARKAIRDRIGALREAEAVQASATALPWYVQQRMDWREMNLSQRRAFLDQTLAAVVIDPSPTAGRNTVDLTRVELHYKDGTRQRLSNNRETVPVYSLETGELLTEWTADLG